MGKRYEGICRHAISRIYRLPIEQIYSGSVAGLSNQWHKLKHQVDLYWEASDGVCTYKVLANAKWRNQTVTLPEMMALIGVWRDIGAHKAMLITNTGFDIGVVEQAKEKGIALLVVRPTIDLREMVAGKIAAVVAEVEKLAAERPEPLFSVEVVRKGIGEWARGRVGEGETVEGGIWLIGGSGDGGVEGVENKAMGMGRLSNKMIGG